MKIFFIYSFYFIQKDSGSWSDLHENKKLMYDNGCHSLNRAYCYEDETRWKEGYNLLKKTTQAHLYKDSVSCAEELFHISARNIKLSIIGLFLALVLF